MMPWTKTMVGDGKTGPELTHMGAQHPAKYFAESILAPSLRTANSLTIP
jgi:hypothetical protein